MAFRESAINPNINSFDNLVNSASTTPQQLNNILTNLFESISVPKYEETVLKREASLYRILNLLDQIIERSSNQENIYVATIFKDKFQSLYNRIFDLSPEDLDALIVNIMKENYIYDNLNSYYGNPQRDELRFQYIPTSVFDTLSDILTIDSPKAKRLLYYCFERMNNDPMYNKLSSDNINELVAESTWSKLPKNDIKNIYFDILMLNPNNFATNLATAMLDLLIDRSDYQKAFDTFYDLYIDYFGRSYLGDLGKLARQGLDYKFLSFFNETFTRNLNELMTYMMDQLIKSEYAEYKGTTRFWVIRNVIAKVDPLKWDAFVVDTVRNRSIRSNYEDEYLIKKLISSGIFTDPRMVRPLSIAIRTEYNDNIRKALSEKLANYLTDSTLRYKTIYEMSRAKDYNSISGLLNIINDSYQADDENLLLTIYADLITHTYDLFAIQEESLLGQISSILIRHYKPEFIDIIKSGLLGKNKKLVSQILYSLSTSKVKDSRLVPLLILVLRTHQYDQRAYPFGESTILDQTVDILKQMDRKDVFDELVLLSQQDSSLTPLVIEILGSIRNKEYNKFLYDREDPSLHASKILNLFGSNDQIENFIRNQLNSQYPASHEEASKQIKQFERHTKQKDKIIRQITRGKTNEKIAWRYAEAESRVQKILESDILPLYQDKYPQVRSIRDLLLIPQIREDYSELVSRVAEQII